MQPLRYNYTFFFLLIPLFLSAFTHLWNPIGFLHPEHDEGIYIQRTLRVLEELDLRDSMFGYDHPYFGQLFLAGALGITGYPHSMSPKVGDLDSIQNLWVSPRLFMGLLAVIDTFLIYKITELRYSRKVALIASTLFAVMPITWFLRVIWLDSIQLPFLLGSILFAIYAEKSNLDKNTKIKNSPSVLLSGIFLGLAIFTKIPAFTMIPLIGFLIYTNGNNKCKWQKIGLWFVPIILIPSFWPVYAVSVGELDDWIEGINYQTQRAGASSFIDDILRNFKIDPFLLVIGAIGILYAAIKRDSFLLLWAFPYTIFLYFIGFTQYFHFILIFPLFCIAAAETIVDLSKKIRNANIQKVLPFVVISVIGFVGLVNTTLLITQNDALPYFKAEAFLTKYLLYNSNDKMTVISNPFYLWIPQYVFHLDHEYYGFLGVGEANTKNLIFIVDDDFKDILSADYDYAHRLEKMYASYDKKLLAAFADAKVLRSNVLQPSPQTRQIDLIDKTHIWSSFNNAVLNQKNNTLSIKVDTTKSGKVNSGASLPFHLENHSSLPRVLTLDYSTKSIKGNAKFSVDVIDSSSDKILWSTRLSNSNGLSKIRTFYLADNISNDQIELRLRIIPRAAGEHTLTINNMRIT
jgi:Dolichyl-phosphate-mannose-protein mannosyltransferase